MQRIMTLTMNPAVDQSCRVKFVVADRKLRCADVRQEPGGGGINVARAIDKLGGAACALYPAGGPVGALFEDLLGREGIEQCVVRIDGCTRRNLIVAEEGTGRQFRFGMPGPVLREAEWKKCLAELDRANNVDYFVVSGSLPPGAPDEFYAHAAQKLSQRGIRVILDTRGVPLQRAARAGVFLLKPNMRELRELSGRELEEEGDQESFARHMVDSGWCDAVVLSLGGAGALLVAREVCQRIRSPAVPVRSTVGAGDSMVAGITLALARGQSLESAARFGVAAGAAAVMTPGSELCRRESAERLYSQMQS
jgi:6-phosphofructokinase 2